MRPARLAQAEGSTGMQMSYLSAYDHRCKQNRSRCMAAWATVCRDRGRREVTCASAVQASVQLSLPVVCSARLQVLLLLMDRVQHPLRTAQHCMFCTGLPMAHVVGVARHRSGVKARDACAGMRPRGST